MATIDQVAHAFATGHTLSSHNSRTDGMNYYLHWNRIAERIGAHHVYFTWCGWYSVTTANHMNKVLEALRVPTRVSYAKARDAGTTDFTVEV